MKLIVIIILIAEFSFGAANNTVLVSGTLMNYSKKEVTLKTSSGKIITLPRNKNDSFEGFITGQAKIQMNVPAEVLNRLALQSKGK